MSLSTSYVLMHIYIEDMRTKKALSERRVFSSNREYIEISCPRAWIPLVSVFCSSGAVSGIRGKQMTPAVASERSIFSKNHNCNSYIEFSVSR